MLKKMVIQILATGGILFSAAAFGFSAPQIESLSCGPAGARTDILNASVYWNCDSGETGAVSLVVASAARQVSYTENSPSDPAAFSEAESRGSYSVKAVLQCTDAVTHTSVIKSSLYENIICP